MSVQLSAGGRAYIKPEQREYRDTSLDAPMPNPSNVVGRTFEAWHAKFLQMIALASSLTPEKRTVEKMRAWVENPENRFHDQYDQRFATYWDRNADEFKQELEIAWLAEECSRIQGRMNDGDKAKATALLGYVAYPYVCNSIGAMALDRGISDVPELLRLWHQWISENEVMV